MNKKLNFKKLIWQIPFWMLVLVVIGTLIMVFDLGGKLPNGQMLFYGAVNSILIGGMFMIGISLMTKLLDKHLPWLNFPLKRLIVQCLATTIFSLVIIVLAIVMTGLLWHEKFTRDFVLQSGYFMVKIAFSFILVSTLITNAILFFRNWKEAAVQQEKMKREQLALQYETLKSQVNPHFLFNNLNSLTSLIGSNPDKAIDFVKKLSEVYRYVLDQRDHELVSLELEMKFLESYVYLQQIRFGDNLKVEIDLLPGNFKVIPLSVQMMVENAIKHNEISDKNPLIIMIYNNQEQFLVVENKLQKKFGSEGSGSGIQNISERYAFFTDRKVVINISDSVYRISIPLLTD